jgi:hypothetical protein
LLGWRDIDLSAQDKPEARLLLEGRDRLWLPEKRSEMLKEVHFIPRLLEEHILQFEGSESCFCHRNIDKQCFAH